jgi:hypothetical protein
MAILGSDFSRYRDLSSTIWRVVNQTWQPKRGNGNGRRRERIPEIAERGAGGAQRGFGHGHRRFIANRGPLPLTLPNGQSATVEVAAVKSSKRIAGAIGQVLVELELDAKKMPEKVLDIVMKPIYDTGITLAAYDTGMNTGVEHNTVIEHISVPPANDTIHETILGGPGSGLGTVVPPPAPFAAKPLQASISKPCIKSLRKWISKFRRSNLFRTGRILGIAST